MDVDFAKTVEEVFRPFLDEFPEGQEVEDAGVLVNDCVAAVVMVEEGVHFTSDEFFDVVLAVGLVFLCSEVEGVVVGLVGFLKDA